MTPVPLRRAVVLSVVLLIAAAAIGRASRSEPVPPRESFATFPMDIGEWRGESADRFDQRILTVLGVDDYLNRVYVAARGRTVGLYVGFYRSQRQGDTIHSPLNCLPGAGWQPVKKQRVTIPVRDGRGGTRHVTVNRFTIQRGLDRQVVLYWYQSHGRVVASEYRGKVYTVLDAIRLNRTDAAMVRVVSPVDAPGDEPEALAEKTVVGFAQALFPLLETYLPEPPAPGS